MKIYKFLFYLIGLFLISPVVSAQQEPDITDTLDLGTRLSPFSFTETLDMSNRNYWRCYKINLPVYTKLRVSYNNKGRRPSVSINVYDADKRITMATLDGYRSEKTIYTVDLPPNVYYFKYRFGGGEITALVEGVEEPDAKAKNSHNCIRTRTMTAEDGSDYIENIEYFDAFGRLYESIDVGVTPTGNDLATLIEYDEFGRDSKKWLPGVVENNNGKYVPRSSLINSVYATYGNHIKPYKKIGYESSPLNRVVTLNKPCSSWTYEGAESVTYRRLYNLDDNQFRDHNMFNPYRYENGIRKSHYPDGTLELIYFDGEDGEQSVEYTDARGRVILKRNALKATSAISNPQKGKYADVQYFYDDIGNLLYVYTPLSADYLTGDINPDHYIYIYQYDYRDRRIAVKFPQCEWSYYVYDRADRLILSQNGEQRKTNQWTFYKYDTMGRKILEGTCITNRSHNELRALCQTELIEESFDCIKPYGYTWNRLTEIIPSNSPILNAYYYDNYDILGYQSVANYTPNFKGDARYTGNNEGYESKGLLTVSSTAILGGNVASRLHKLYYYDRMERPVATISDIYSPQKGVEDYKQAEYLSYTFAGNVSKRILYLAGKDEERYDYTYDHAGRLVSTRYNLFSSYTDFKRNTYDELGRLASTTPLGLTDYATTYGYDLQSRMISLQQKYFGEELTYTLGGNISKQKFNDGGCYTFTYDLLSRMTQADYTNGMANRSCTFSYNKYGEILSLKRFAGNAYETIDKNITYRRYDEAHSAGFDDGYMFKCYANDKIGYKYNTCGSLVSAVNRGISSIKYNQLNLPEQMDVKHTSAEARNEYTYDAEGNKLNVKYRWNPQYVTNPIIGSAVNESSLTMSRNVLYQGNHIWFDNKEMWLNEIGYRRPDTSKFYFYVKDHQGNNRVVIDQTGKVVQRNDYYPYGLPMGNAEGVPIGYYDDKDGQPFKYNGKELDRMHGVTIYDYVARSMDPTFPMFLSVDPLCEKHYNISPYAYCGNNFVNAIDPDGRDYWSTNDPEEIARFLDVLKRSQTKSENFDYSDWDHATDAEFTGNLTYNDVTKTFYTSYGQVINGKVVINGISFSADSSTDYSASIFVLGSPSPGIIEQDNILFDLMLGGTKAGWTLLKAIISRGNSYSTVCTFNANKSFPSVQKEKMGKPKRNMPGNNKVQNKQIEDLARKYKLDKDEKGVIHELISGEGLGYHEIEQLIKDYFNK